MAWCFAICRDSGPRKSQISFIFRSNWQWLKTAKLNNLYLPKHLILTEKEFLSKADAKRLPERGSYTWQSPSNIALVKYWGKTEPQIPKNPSISFTLSNCHTTTVLRFNKKDNQSDYGFKVFFEGEEKPDFAPKIRKFFERIDSYIPFLKDYAFEIHTENSFPHSSGIASSASGMSALSLCLMSLEKEACPEMTEQEFIRKASFLSRLGSGSASRSLEGELVVWGKHESVPGSSDLYGVLYPHDVHPVFKTFHDTILLVDKGVKQVSSTLGHQLMHDHPFASERFAQANRHLSELIPILSEGDLDGFIRVVEKEALALHAMMLTSDPYFILMRPNTLKIIEKIWGYRESNKSKACFTLDAGANVHLLYPSSEKEAMAKFIGEELAPLCQNNEYINDLVGPGARQID